MIAPLAILRFVIDHTVVDLNLPDAEVPLVIGSVILASHKQNSTSEKPKINRFTMIGQIKLPDLEILAQGTK